MFVLLVGPKGSGKSHVGRVLERHLAVHLVCMAIENVRKVHKLSTSAAIPAKLVLENLALSELEIVHLISSKLPLRPGAPPAARLDPP